MTQNRTIARVTSAGILACGLAIYAAQAGILPGLAREAGVAGAEAPATVGAQVAMSDLAPIRRPDAAPSVRSGATTTGYVPDPFVKLQSHFVPPRSGFATSPAIRPDLPATGGAPAAARPAAFVPAARPAAPGERPAAEAGRRSPFGLPCGLSLSAEAAPGAMIALGVTAPCHADAVLQIEHAGISITTRTDAFGLAAIDLPAFDSPAIVAVRLADGTEDRVMLTVPEIAGYERFAVAWHGDQGLGLHAREGGADWRSEGHVHADAPRGPQTAGAGGFLTQLGDPGLASPGRAQVYSVPLGMAHDVELSIDAPVTAANCGRPARARIVRSQAGRIEASPVRFTYPGCEAVGDTLVLQNLVQDLRLAAN
jgi:hypothetical protein